MTVFSLIASLIRREPLLVVPYAVYSLLTFLLTTYLVPQAAAETVQHAFQLPYILLLFLIVGDFLARGVTLVLVATQFSQRTTRPWGQWWQSYAVLSFVFCVLYLLMGVWALGPKNGMSSLHALLLMLAVIAALLSVVLILFAPFLMFFRGVGALSAVRATAVLLRYRTGLVFRIVVMNMSLVFVFVFLGMMMAQLPVLGATLSYLFQALGQIVALIYSFIVIGTSEWKSGVLLADEPESPVS